MKVVLAKDILKSNDDKAAENRRAFEKLGLFTLNLISSPGSGKTRLLENTVQRLSSRYRIGVIEGDITTTRDAERVARHCEQVVQINTDGGCHLDSKMVSRSIEELSIDKLDVLFIENVGNLVCPSEFDLGESCRVVVLSVTEGDDKPEKYPYSFDRANVIIINKIDMLEHTDFDMARAEEIIRQINRDAVLFKLSAVTGEGYDAWIAYLENHAFRKK